MVQDLLLAGMGARRHLRFRHGCMSYAFSGLRRVHRFGTAWPPGVAICAVAQTLTV